MDTAILLYKNVCAQWSGYNWGMGPGMMGWGYGMGWLGPVFMLIFLIAVILIIVFIVKWLASSARHDMHGAIQGDTALEILRKRYARGEIDKEEFEEKKKDLES